jgi:ATP-dependent protease ClpP protease subunit
MQRWPRWGSKTKEIDVKKLVLFALIALGLSCSAVHKPQAETPASVADATANTKVADGPEFSPEDLMRMLRIESDEPTPAAAKCETPFCVTYVRLDGPIMHGSTKGLLSAIEHAGPADTLMIDINTPGGSVSEGFELEKALEATKAKVYCVVDGDAYSMGFFMLQSCQNRVMTKRSALMAHEPLTMSEADEMRTIHDLEETVQDLRTDARGIAEHAIKRMKITFEQYVEKTADKKWFMAWPEALQVGAVDCVFAGNGAEALSELQHTGTLSCQK